MHEVTDQDFKKEVLEADKPVVVDFFASWCGPCQELLPQIEALSKKYGSKIKFTKMNVEKNPKTPNQFAVMSIPTILIFNNGKVAAHFNNSDCIKEVEEKIKNLVQHK